MPAGNIGRLDRPPKEYSQGDEVKFRRDLETQLSDLQAEIRAVNSGSSPRGSLASKRENMFSVPVGITEYS